ncbi:methionine aminopeptidase [Desulforamulus profundi]|uniref:Methionine aminopeptidase n=1 Tax=Desulforamulus profundi TaxID=1383067 RepID=A0A2C6MF54_9FIRM|nr:methionine aminopeptidase [Desulforamulus profundi]
MDCAKAYAPMITLGSWRAKVDPDGWTARTVDGSICVQYEHTIAVTENGPVILT